MRWREIGPMRAGRTRALAGVPPSPPPSTSARSTAASGRPPTPATPGTASGTTAHRLHRRHRRLARDPNIIYVGSGEGLRAPISPPATASTSPPTPARPGPTSACATASRSARSPSTRTIPNRVFVAVEAIRTAPTKSAASTAPPTAARHSSAFSSSTNHTGASEVADRPPAPQHRLRRHVAAPGRRRGRTAR